MDCTKGANQPVIIAQQVLRKPRGTKPCTENEYVGYISCMQGFFQFKQWVFNVIQMSDEAMFF